MYNYKFPKEHLIGIMMHLESFDRIIMQMIPDNDFYIIELDDAISDIQRDHLIEEYNLEVVQ